MAYNRPIGFGDRLEPVLDSTDLPVVRVREPSGCRRMPANGFTGCGVCHTVLKPKPGGAVMFCSQDGTVSPIRFWQVVLPECSCSEVTFETHRYALWVQTTTETGMVTGCHPDWSKNRKRNQFRWPDGRNRAFRRSPKFAPP